ncbi:MarR family winged helix-turn-helix transcriptional regulator [Amorphus orientalis]|uniref:DNA-binding MarR family transcriptional regulator n=1 Tax=Amorphus orientalis TaxID=649198 RepID=A0AAE3VPS4_9HYPH|nr:winged helix DNA-binding protein [Amorphus orientalis]MDQ0316054.1 DNA-binding MarR family transcriptional regulator [Amorphus orientalis]
MTMHIGAPARPAALTIDDLKPVYLEAVKLVERVHRRFLDVVKDEFDRLGRTDVSNVQAVLIYYIGDSAVTASELKTRGYYLGSNVSYNVKKLVEQGLVRQERSESDKRTVRLTLTDEGQEIAAVVEALFDRHVRTMTAVSAIDPNDLQSMTQNLQRLDRFWQDQILYRL